MQLTMERTEPLYGRLMAEANNDQIREFTVPERYNFHGPQSDLEGGHWRSVNPDTIAGFSAVAYFFAESVHREQNVPVGIINASLGGSPVEAWLSEDALQAYPDELAEGKRYRDEAFEAQVIEQDEARAQAWHEVLNAKDQGLKNGEPRWLGGDVDLAEWQPFEVPGLFPTDGGKPINGAFWFRTTLDVPLHLAGQPGELDLRSEESRVGTACNAT